MNGKYIEIRLWPDHCVKYISRSGWGRGVPCNPDARDWPGNMILAELAMQDQIIRCKHDFILRFDLDMQMRCISPLTDETASNITFLAREMHVWGKARSAVARVLRSALIFSQYWAEQSAQTESSVA